MAEAEILALLTQVGAVVCLVVGIATVWTPISTGLPLIAVGLALLLTSSRRFSRLVGDLRRRYAGLNAWLHCAEPHLPRKRRIALARTRRGISGRRADG